VVVLDEMAAGDDAISVDLATALEVSGGGLNLLTYVYPV
jgi:hypothetical protein